MANKRTHKRANGEGTLYQRKDGRWEAKVTIKDSSGQSKRKTFTGTSQGEVKKKRDDYLLEIRNGTYVDPNNILFGEWVQNYLELYKKPIVRKSTYSKYLINFNTHIKPELGQIELQKLNTDIIQRFYNNKAKTHSSGTIEIIHQVINGSLNWAVDERRILSNPAKKTKRPPVRYKEVKTLSQKEFGLYLQTAKTETRFYAAFLLDITTGLRRGELLALDKAEHIDLKEGIVKVRRSLSRVNDYDGKSHLEFTELKTKKSKRDIPILPEVLKEIKSHLARQAQDRLILGQSYEENNLLFPNQFGKPLEPRKFLTIHKRILKKAGLREDIKIHTLRHTFGTMLAQSGENPKTIQELLGHSDIRTTFNLYIHDDIDDKKRAVKSISDKIKNLV